MSRSKLVHITPRVEPDVHEALLEKACLRNDSVSFYVKRIILKWIEDECPPVDLTNERMRLADELMRTALELESVA